MIPYKALLTELNVGVEVVVVDTLDRHNISKHLPSSCFHSLQRSAVVLADGRFTYKRYGKQERESQAKCLSYLCELGALLRRSFLSQCCHSGVLRWLSDIHRKNGARAWLPRVSPSSCVTLIIAQRAKPVFDTGFEVSSHNLSLFP